MKISHSDLRKFSSCRRKWGFASKHGMNLTPKQTEPNLFLGRGFHEALNVYYANNPPEDHTSSSWAIACVDAWCAYQKQEILNTTDLMFDDQMDEINETIDLLKGMVRNYVEWAQENDGEHFEEVVDREVHFEYPIRHPETGEQVGTLEGYLDGVVRDNLGQLWLAEDKTASRIQTDHLDLDEQTARYLPVIEQLYGEKPAGVIYTIARKKLPTIPNETKSGKVSRQKVTTTYDRYRDRLIEVHGGEDEVPWDYYEDVLDYYRGQDNPFFHREPIIKNEHEIEEMKRRVWVLHEEMRRAKEDENLQYPSPSPMVCSWCSFREPCVAMNDGSDVEWLLNEKYEERERA